MKGFVLSPPTAKKVLKTIEIVARQQKNPDQTIPRTRVPTMGFFARITGSDGTGRYSWEAVNFNEYGDMTASSYTGDYADSTGHAVELHRSKDVLTGHVVEFKGARTVNVFQFAYAPGVVPGITSSVITARSGNTPGSGTMQVEQVDATTGDLELGQTITIHNSTDSTGETGKRAHATFGEGRWWWTLEACETDST